VDEGDAMIVADTANLHTFVDAFRFIGDHPTFLLTKTLEQIGRVLGLTRERVRQIEVEALNRLAKVHEMKAAAYSG